MDQDKKAEGDLVVLGEATTLTKGDWFPYAMEALVIPDFYDVP